MERVNWERWAPASGIAAAILFLVAFGIAAADAPRLGDTAIEVASFYEEESGRVRLGAALFGFSILFFLWFLGSLTAAMRAVGEPRMGTIAAAAGVALATGFLVIIGVYAGLALTVAELADPGAIEVAADVIWALGVLLAFPMATLAAAAAVASLRSGLLPAWFGWVSAFAALLFAAGGTTWAEEGVWAPDGVYAYVVLFAFVAWLLAVSALLLWARRDVRAASEPERGPTSESAPSP